jgi:hypothetical protein
MGVLLKPQQLIMKMMSSVIGDVYLDITGTTQVCKSSEVLPQFFHLPVVYLLYGYKLL